MVSKLFVNTWIEDSALPLYDPHPVSHQLLNFFFFIVSLLFVLVHFVFESEVRGLLGRLFLFPTMLSDITL